MCLTVPYTPYLDPKTGKTVKKPVISVVLEHLGKELNLLGLVDSGADSTVFNAEYGLGIGLPVDRGAPESIGGIGGSLNCKPCEATLKFLTGEHARQIKTKIMFSREYKRPFVLLGHDTIFKLYEITFNDKDQKFIFKKFV